MLGVLAGQALGFGLGLGSAAARAAKKTVDKAASQSSGCVPRRTGTTGSVTLTAAPINPASVVFATPVGNVNPPGHTFPTDHMYFYYVNPGASGTPGVFDVYAPADGYISNVFSGVEQGAVQYKLTITHTDTFQTYLDHVMTLDASVAAAATQSCPWIHVTAGQLIGTAGGVHGENAVDLGVINLQVSQPFINPGHYGISANSDSPLKYYAGSLQTQLYSLVSRTQPDYLGNTEKDGIFCYDSPGTVAGNWAAQGSDSYWLNPDSWDQQLSFSYNAQYANEINVAFGGKNGSKTVKPSSGLGPWRVQSGATPPQSLTVASGAYGYQLQYWDPNNGNFAGGTLGLLMVQLLDASTLKVEYFDGDQNASEPFDSNAVIYTR